MSCVEKPRYHPVVQREEMEQTLDVCRLSRPPMLMAQQHMDEFWRDRQKDIETTKDFSEHVIPMARLKKIASSQKGNMMMTFDMPAFLSKMCELFVQELAIRAWACAQSHNRCIILDIDIAEAIASIESYDFLVDILHNHRAKYNSTPCSVPTTKRCRLVDQPSISHLPQQHQRPQFAPTYTSTIPMTPNLMPPISHYRPALFSSLPQEVSVLMAPTPNVNGSMLLVHNIANGLGLQGNNINVVTNNNVTDNTIDSSALLSTTNSPTLLESSGALLRTPNYDSYICMMGMINSSDASGSGTSNVVVANQTSLALPGHFDPTIILESLCPSFLPRDNDDMIVAMLEDAHNSNTMCVANDVVNDTAMVLNGQQDQHERETNVECDDQNEIYGNIDVETINATTTDGNKCSISWDELGMADDSLLETFLEELQLRKDDALDTGIALDKNSHFDDIVWSNPSTSNGNK